MVVIGYTRLQTAALMGDSPAVKRLLEDPEIKPNFAEDWGRSALNIAVRLGNLKCVEALVKDRRTDVNHTDRSGFSSLYLAAYHNLPSCVAALLQHHKIDVGKASNSGMTPILIAAELNNYKTLELLIKDGRSDVNEATRSDKFTPLYLAARLGSLQATKLLLGDIQTNVNLRTIYGTNALFMAAFSGHISTIQLLLMDGLAELVEAYPHWRSVVVSVFLCNAALESPLPVVVLKYVFSFLKRRTDIEPVSFENNLTADSARANFRCSLEYEVKRWIEESPLAQEKSITPLALARARGHETCALLLEGNL